MVIVVGEDRRLYEERTTESVAAAGLLRIARSFNPNPWEKTLFRLALAGVTT